VIKKQQKIQLVIYALMKVKKSLFSYTTDERTNATGFLPGKPINLWVLSVHGGVFCVVQLYRPKKQIKLMACHMCVSQTTITICLYSMFKPCYMLHSNLTINVIQKRHAVCQRFPCHLGLRDRDEKQKTLDTVKGALSAALHPLLLVVLNQAHFGFALLAHNLVGLNVWSGLRIYLLQNIQLIVFTT
jgi:hypothetical protein